MHLALTITLGVLAAWALWDLSRHAKQVRHLEELAKIDAMIHAEAISQKALSVRRCLDEIAEARRLLSDKRCHGRIDSTRGAWEAERDRWLEVNR